MGRHCRDHTLTIRTGADRNALAIENHGLVVTYAIRYSRYQVMSLEDLIQEGWIGLLRACELYDASKGYKFATYAVQWIRCCVRRAIARSRRQLQAAIEADLRDDEGWSPLAVARSNEAPSRPMEALDQRESLAHLMEQSLTPRQRQIITARFGLEAGPPMTRRAIASRFGVSQQRIAAIEAAALDRLNLVRRGFRVKLATSRR
jgi:RNA polymerase sigma factor (sigma-70 family)